MKIELESKYGHISYYERPFQGTRIIKIKDEELKRIDKYKYTYGKDKRKVEVFGNFLSGINLEINGQFIEILPAPKIREYLICAIPFFLLTLWGSIPFLTNIIPLLGSVWGAAINAGLFVIVLIIERMNYKLLNKIIVISIFTLISFLICFLIGYKL